MAILLLWFAYILHGGCRLRQRDYENDLYTHMKSMGLGSVSGDTC
jgi:hypothetical protein